MKNAINKIFVVAAFAATTHVAIAQTPYDDFAPSETKKEMLKLPETTFRAINNDSLSLIRFIELDKELLLLSYYDQNNNLIKVAQLKETDFKWLSVDPLAQKYPGMSPYNFVAGNPIRFIDPDGREIWIAYGSNQKVKWEGGNLLNADGSAYKGNDAFVNNVSTSLGLMNSAKIGQTVLNQLSSSHNSFEFQNNFPTNQNGEPINNALSFTGNANGGGIIKAAALGNEFMQTSQKLGSAGHELFHGYQQEFGETGATINREVGAYLYEHALIGSIGLPYEGFGTPGTTAGENYGNAMNNLLYGNSFNQTDYQSALDNFKQGSPKNATGIYNNFSIKPNDTNPVIKQLAPLTQD